MADFPPVELAGQEDSGKHSRTQSDKATMTFESEGGYKITRRRHTRRPREQYDTGFTCITEAQRIALYNFWNSKVGGQHFTWNDPVTGLVKQVRFVGRYTEKYSGMGSQILWNITDLKLEEI
tara:strand:- start:361 stop:726 length:366 start_codon:yes stop_codon:yes gene_type:complete